MDLQAIRRQRLKQLIKEFFRDVKAEFARHIGKPTTDVSRWLSEASKHGRGITERTARDIEVKCDKPKYWLDVESDDALVSMATEVREPPRARYGQIARFEALATDLTPEQLEEVLAALDKEVLRPMAVYKRMNEDAVRIFGMRKAGTVPAARAAARLPPAPRPEGVPQTRKLPFDAGASSDDASGDLFDDEDDC